MFEIKLHEFLKSQGYEYSLISDFTILARAAGKTKKEAFNNLIQYIKCDIEVSKLQIDEKIKDYIF